MEKKLVCFISIILIAIGVGIDINYGMNEYSFILIFVGVIYPFLYKTKWFNRYLENNKRKKVIAPWDKILIPAAILLILIACISTYIEFNKELPRYMAIEIKGYLLLSSLLIFIFVFIYRIIYKRILINRAINSIDLIFKDREYSDLEDIKKSIFNLTKIEFFHLNYDKVKNKILYLENKGIIKRELDNKDFDKILWLSLANDNFSIQAETDFYDMDIIDMDNIGEPEDNMQNKVDNTELSTFDKSVEIGKSIARLTGLYRK